MKKIHAMILLSTLAIAMVSGISNISAQKDFKFSTRIIVRSDPTMTMIAGLASHSMRDIGIDAKTVAMEKSDQFAREFGWGADPTVVGKTYVEGGYDLGYHPIYVQTASIFYDLKNRYHSESRCPASFNWGQVNNAELDSFIDAFDREPDAEKAGEIFEKASRIIWDQAYEIILILQDSVWAIDPKIENFASLNPTQAMNLEKITLKDKTKDDHVSAVLALTMDPTGFIRFGITATYEGRIIMYRFYEQLASYDDKGNLHPRLAESWETTDGGKTWYIYLRQGVKWHDGVKFNATDLVESWRAVMTEEWASTDYGLFLNIIGSKENVQIIDEYTVKVTLVQVQPRFPYGELFQRMNIYPWHILREIDPAELKTHPITTGMGTYTVNLPDGGTYVAKGPIGTGAYIYDEWDATKRAVHVVKNPDYWGEEPFVDEWWFTTVTSTDAAIAGLKTGELDILDSSFNLGPKAADFDPSWGILVKQPGTVFHTITFNMNHPIFGTGEATPLGQSDPNRAAEAARYVRKAINHAMPRQAIADEIFEGFARPLGQYAVPLHIGYNEKLMPPYEYNVTLAINYMEKAGYDMSAYKEPEPTPEPGLAMPTEYMIAIGVVVAVVAIAAIYIYLRRR